MSRRELSWFGSSCGPAEMGVRRFILIALAFFLVSAYGADGECGEGAYASIGVDVVKLSRVGLEVADVTPAMARRADLDRVKGCFVQKIFGGSPAEAAGMQVGDIIVSFNDRGIRNARELKNDLAGTEPGEVVKMCVVRQDYRTTVYLTPGDVPPQKSGGVEEPAWLGVEVTEVVSGSMESRRLAEAGKEGGVVVKDVTAGSPADRAGIRPGDVIMSFNLRKVRTVKELTTDLAGAGEGDKVRICIMRGDIRKTLYPVLGSPPRSSYVLSAYEGDAYKERLAVLGKQQLATVFPEASRFERFLQPVPHYKAYGGSGEFLGVAFVTTEVCPEESEGFQGPISTLVGLSTTGKIVSVRLLDHMESAKYVQGRLSQFIRQYINKNAAESFVLGVDIDAISGATITSSAINNSIEVGSDIILTNVLNVAQPDAVTTSRRLSWSHLIWQMDLLLLLVIAAVAIAGYYRRSQIFRFFVLGLSFLFLGYYKGGGFSIYDVINIFQGDFPVFATSLNWYALLAFIALTAIVIGRFYCGWLCPFGALTEMLYRALPRLRVKVPLHLDRWLRTLKYLFLFVILLVGLLMGRTYTTSVIVENVEPFGTLFQFSGDFMMWFFVILFLLGSIFISRFYCKYICPLGAFFALVAVVVSFVSNKLVRLAPAPGQRRRVPLSMACPMDALRHEKDYAVMNMSNGECIVCFRH